MTPTRHPCEVCGARVVDLRRGRCFACYMRWCDARPVGLGSCCIVCGDRRGENLRRMELHGAWVAFCGNCAVRAQRLDPMPRTLEAIRARLARERRARERRVGLPDPRPQRAERRGLERRSMGHAPCDDAAAPSGARALLFHARAKTAPPAAEEPLEDGDLMLLDDSIFIDLVVAEDDVDERARTVARA